MKEICGLPLAELSTSPDHPTPFWKMCQVLLVVDISETFLKTLPKSGMMRNGKLYQRKKQVLVIKETDSGLWPTPTNSMMTVADINQAKFSGDSGKRPKYKNCNKFPTPQHRDFRSGQAKRVGRKGFQTDLNNFVVKFPTPTASDFKKRGPKSKQQGLPEIIKNYPTPASRDYKGGRKPETLKKSGRNETNSLNDKVNSLEGAALQLNPDWVEWLMGWPVGWSNIEPLKELIWLNPSIDPYPELPRITTNKKNRTNRLKAIGNGQFPQCVAEAWNILK